VDRKSIIYNQEVKRIPYEKLIDNLIATCDEFSLVTYYGTFKLDKDTSETVLKNAYNQLSDNDKQRIEFGHRELLECDTERDLLEELKLPDNEALLKNHVRHELSYCWHCTTSDSLMIVHYFACNNETSEWLKKRKNIYDFSLLDDLAFFKDGICVLSVCRHEEMSCIKYFDGLKFTSAFNTIRMKSGRRG
jgi:hypothetical protein